ncbi:DNA-directed RNA polymerase III subunit [Trichinella spiralis]|uniref:DNA-directed RNA polymerase III subunit n=1 Tax=Trichinella spiralis TaxID=6334 RepID=A0ABR3KVG6_TRISP
MESCHFVERWFRETNFNAGYLQASKLVVESVCSKANFIMKLQMIQKAFINDKEELCLTVRFLFKFVNTFLYIQRLNCYTTEFTSNYWHYYYYSL